MVAVQVAVVAAWARCVPGLCCTHGCWCRLHLLPAGFVVCFGCVDSINARAGCSCCRQGLWYALAVLIPSMLVQVAVVARPVCRVLRLC